MYTHLFDNKRITLLINGVHLQLIDMAEIKNAFKQGNKIHTTDFTRNEIICFRITALIIMNYFN